MYGDARQMQKYPADGSTYSRDGFLFAPLGNCMMSSCTRSRHGKKKKKKKAGGWRQTMQAFFFKIPLSLYQSAAHPRCSTQRIEEIKKCKISRPVAPLSCIWITCGLLFILCTSLTLPLSFPMPFVFPFHLQYSE